MAVVLCFHSFLLTFGSVPCESSDYEGKKERESVIAACSISVFHASKSDSLISSGFQRAALDYAKVVSERTKNLFCRCFSNLGSIDISVFWI